MNSTPGTNDHNQEMIRQVKSEITKLLRDDVIDESIISKMLAVKLCSDDYNQEARYKTVLNTLLDKELERLAKQKNNSVDYVQGVANLALEEMKAENSGNLEVTADYQIPLAVSNLFNK